MSEPTPNLPTTTTSSGKRKPRISLAIATAFGLGYLPKAPGTFGSLGGVALTLLYWFSIFPASTRSTSTYHDVYLVILPQGFTMLFALLIAGVGVFVASRTANYLGTKDPQIVVIDEVSGQPSHTSGLARRLPTGNICCWALYFFVSSIFGSRSPRGKPNRSPAAWESWRMIGSREFTQRWACGSRGRSGFRYFFVAFAFRRASYLGRKCPPEGGRYKSQVRDRGNSLNGCGTY